MRLEANGFLPATAYDFDRAVMTLARVVEAKRDEMKDKLVSLPSSPPKGSHVIQVPRYTMMELLFDAEGVDTDPASPPSAALSHLPTSLL